MTIQAPRTVFFAPALQSFVRRALRATGVGEEDASLVAEVLVASDIRGIESHGVARLEKFYVGRIRDGAIDPHATALTLRETPTSARVSGALESSSAAKLSATPRSRSYTAATW